MLPKNLRTLWTETSPDKVLARAHKLLEKGKLDGAVSTLKDALEAVGDEPRLRFELTQILLEAGRAREAADGYKQLLKASPDAHRQLSEAAEWARAHQLDAKPLHEVLAEHLVGRRDFQSAFASLERIGKDDLKPLLESRLSHLNRFLGKDGRSIPRSALPLTYLAALTHEAMGDDPQAVRTYGRIAAAYPAEMPAVEQRLKGIVARHYRSGPLREELAKIYLSAGQEQSAIEEYVQMAEIDPQSAPQAAAALEELATASGNAREVQWGLVRIRHRQGSHAQLLRAAGALIAEGGHLEELLRLLEQTALESKADPRLKILMGEAAMQLGKTSRAAAFFTSAAAESTAEVRALARESLAKIHEKAPDSAEVILALVDLDVREEALDGAVENLEKLAALPGNESAVVARLQSILLTHSQHPGAEALLESLATKLESAGTSAVFLRRRLRRGGEEAPKALEELKALRESHPDEPEVLMALAEANLATGDADGAWKILSGFLDGTTGPDPFLLHMIVLVAGSSPERFDEVVKKFTEASPALAGSPEGQFAIGEAAAKCGKLPAALEAFKIAAAFSPAAAAETIAALRALCPVEESGQAAATLAELLAETGDFSAAAAALGSPEAAGRVPPALLDKLQKAFRADPENVDLRIVVATALAAGGQTAHARRLIEDGIRRAGAGAPAPLHLAAGDAWARENNLSEAVRSYARAMSTDKSLAGEAARKLEALLEKDVGHASAHLSLGRARLLEERCREGVNELLTAWSIKPAMGETVLKDLDYASHAFPLEPYVDLARSQILLGQGEVDAASETLGAALQASPVVAGEVLVRLQAMIQSHPSCATAQFHAARAWHGTGRCAEASKAYVAASELAPEMVEKAIVSVGELIESYPGEQAPHAARARLEELRGNFSAAAEAYREALACGAPADTGLEALRRLAAQEGPGRGRALLSLAGALREQKHPEQAAVALEEAEVAAPDLLQEIREEADALCRGFPDSSPVLLTRARLTLASLDPAGSLMDAERLLEMDSSATSAVADLAYQIAEAGGDPVSCALIRARALAAAGAFVEAAEILDAWASKSDASRRSEICLLRARIERRRGDADAALKWIAEAESHAQDRESFLMALHDETLQAVRGVAARNNTRSDLWKALWASLLMGDADGAERSGSRLGLAARGNVGVSEADQQAAREAFSLIASLRGRYAEAAELIAEAPPSRRKAHIMERAGRLEEAAACLTDLCAAGADAAACMERVYGRMAARDFLEEPGCLEAETLLDFSAR